VAAGTNLTTEANSDSSMVKKEDTFHADKIHLFAEKDINLSSHLSTDSHAMFLVLMKRAIIVRVTGARIEMDHQFDICHISFPSYTAELFEIIFSNAASHAYKLYVTSTIQL
jgi:hypothetical protein